jgi:threonine dehydratase
MDEAFRMQGQRGLAMVNAFDDPFIIAGQGTIALELLEDLPEIDTVLVPVSGGGLISGIAVALKSADSRIGVIGVSMERAPVMYHSLRAGTPIEMEEEYTIADALEGGIGLDNQYTFRMIQQYVDDMILVSEDEIAGAMAFALERHHLVVEGAGAVGMAALLCGRVKGVGRNVAVVVSGSNVEIPMLLQIAGNRSGTESKAPSTRQHGG